MSLQSDDKTVVVSGASTGIGRCAAVRLARDGYRVLAGVRTDESARELGSLDQAIVPVVLDITEPENIGRVAEIATESGLHALVNNAGVTLRGPLELVDLQRVRDLFEVNVFGHLALTQALLPALRASRGRIVNVGSVSDRVAFPLYGAYAGSKHALAAMTLALRRELRGAGVAVSLVEPGNVRTPLWEKSFRAQEATGLESSPEARAYYGDPPSSARATDGFIDPDEVAAVIAKIVGVRRPRARYLVGRDARRYAVASRLLPDSLLDRLL